MNIQKQLGWFPKNADVALDIVRMYLGVALIFKGIFFMANRGELIDLINQSGTMWFGPAIMAHYIILAHLTGGFLLAIGLLTRLAAAIQIPILLGAVFLVTVPNFVLLRAQETVEFTALLLFLLCVVFAFGGGRWSLDHYFSKQMAKEADQFSGTPA